MGEGLGQQEETIKHLLEIINSAMHLFTQLMNLNLVSTKAYSK